MARRPGSSFLFAAPSDPCFPRQSTTRDGHASTDLSRKTVNRTLLLMFCTALALQACGGGSSTEVEPATQTEAEKLRNQAAAKAQEVEALVETTPCSESSQCQSLVLQPELPPCFFNRRLDYSAASTRADAARAAASEFNALSARAFELEPPSQLSGSCSENIDFTPLNCVQSKCVRQFVIVPS